MENKDAITLRLPRGGTLTIADIDRRAATYGLSRARFIFRAIEFLLDIDAGLFDKLANYRPGLNAGRVAGALLTKRLAEEVAERKTWGMNRRNMEEFAEGLTFNELFEILEASHQDRERAQKAQILRRSVAQKLELGLPLTADEIDQDIADQRATAAVRRPQRDTEAGARVADGDDLFDATKWQVDKF